jgi:hypothetical protein
MDFLVGCSVGMSLKSLTVEVEITLSASPLITVLSAIRAGFSVADDFSADLENTLAKRSSMPFSWGSGL